MATPESFWLLEVKVAAEWWVNAMTKPQRQDNGDAFQSYFATLGMLTALQRVRPLDPSEQAAVLESFRAAIQNSCLAPKAYDPRPWREEDPNWGSSNRGVGVDYGPDRLLAQAFESAVGPDRASQFASVWPIKTFMWMDPGRVRVTRGYWADVVDIYRADRSVSSSLA